MNTPVHPLDLPLFSDLELEARKLLASIEGVDASTAAVRVVFRARWDNALTVDAIVETSKVLFGFSPAGIESELRRLVRRKILRTRKAQGFYLYELNY